MSNTKDFPLSLTIRAVDKATGTLRKVNANVKHLTAPVKSLGNSFKALSNEARLPQLVAGFKGVGTGIGNVGSAAFSLGAKLLAMGGVGAFALAHVVKGAVDAGDKLSEMADRVGLGVDAYASLQHAAAQADVEQEAFNGAMDQFNKRMGEAKAGGGSLLAFLNKVSPALGKQLKGAKSTEAGLSLITDAMAKIEDPGKRAALAAAAFGRSGLQMGNFLHQGSKSIQEQQAEYMRLSGSQEAFAKGASELDNAMRDTETAFLGLRAAAAGALFPALTALSKAVTEFVVKNRAGIHEWATKAGAAIQAWVDSGGIPKLVKGIQDLAASVSKIVDKLGGLQNVGIAVGLMMSSDLIGATGGLTVSLVKLGVEIVPLAYKLGALLLGALGKVALAILEFNFAPLLSGLTAASTAVWGFLASLGPIVVAAAPFIIAAAAIGAAAYVIYDDWADIKFFFTDLWAGITFNIEQAWGKIKGIIEKMGGVMGILSNPLGAAWTGTKMLSEAAFGGTSAPPMGASAAAAAPASGNTEARVVVDFANVPKGVRVTADRNNTAPLDMSVGPNAAAGY